MAKNMARIENGIVVNVEWCSDETPETDVLKNMGSYMAAIGDTYSDGFFYRNGERVLTNVEFTSRYYESIIAEQDLMILDLQYTSLTEDL